MWRQYLPSNYGWELKCICSILNIHAINLFQMRLDFVNFDITGPYTLSTVVSSVNKGGAVDPNGSLNVGLATQCLTDNFSVINGGGGINPPTICGVNTGEHSKNVNFKVPK